jgi:peptidoglycan/LPS O-acetylase OafA/YrhL
MSNAENFGPPMSGQRLVGLDLLRGFAVLLVMLRHSWPDTFQSAGIVGVVMFFALSGYLITGLLLKDLRSYGRIRYKRFYMHRAFRLLPALLFLLAGFTVVTAIWSPVGDRGSIGKSLFYALTYTMNTPGGDKGSPALYHLWTLATEEQFYLLWPLVLAVGIRIARPGLLTALSIIVVTIACAATMYVLGSNPISVYSWPTSWAVTMLIGALAALENERLERLLADRSALRGALAAAGLGFICAMSLVPDMRAFSTTYLVIGPAIAVCCVAMIFYVKQWSRLPLMGLRPLVALGTVSYAAYLWNGAIQYWLGPRPFSVYQSIALFALSVAAATISWWLIEAPLNGVRKRIDAGASAQQPSSSGDALHITLSRGPRI